MVAKFIEVALVAQVNHQFPDIESQAALPTERHCLKILFVAVEIGQFGGAVEVDMADGTGVQAKRAEFITQQHRDIQVLVFFFLDHRTRVLEVFHFKIDTVGVEQDLGLDQEILDPGLDHQSGVYTVLGVFQSYVELFDPVLNDVEIFGIQIFRARPCANADAELAVNGGEGQNPEKKREEDLLIHCLAFTGITQAGGRKIPGWALLSAIAQKNTIILQVFKECTRMEIEKAEFVGSFPDLKHCPKKGWPEFAFIGRSNVGKSSLINMLCARDEMAHTSGKPGKTQSLNYYSINDRWYLVDLPGYGYARIAKSKRAEFGKMIENYLLERREMVCAFVLLDINVPPQAIDLEFMNWLGENEVPFVIAFTKADKLTKSKIQEQLDLIRKAILESWETLPAEFVTSARKREGRKEMLKFIDDVLKALRNQNN